MRSAIDTLLFAFRNLCASVEGKRVLFINAAYHDDLSFLKRGEYVLQQSFKPYFEALEHSGFVVRPDVPEEEQVFDVVLILLSKNAKHSRFLIAKGILALKDGGILLCAADNKAGGTRIKKVMEAFGVENIRDESRNKARAVWGVNNVSVQKNIQDAINEGGNRPIVDGQFVSNVALYGWDKIDRGSAVLAQYLPKDLKGKGADFGCGYGFLSDYILSHCSKVKRLYCIDGQYEAVELCSSNLKKYDEETEFLWRDLTQHQKDINNLDFIVMNPPFHEGKKTDAAIGKAFIQTAYQSLRRGGCLWMVANNHLPYEEVINDLFFKSEKIYEAQGFKLFRALK